MKVMRGDGWRGWSTTTYYKNKLHPSFFLLFKLQPAHNAQPLDRNHMRAKVRTSPLPTIGGHTYAPPFHTLYHMTHSFSLFLIKLHPCAQPRSHIICAQRYAQHRHFQQFMFVFKILVKYPSFFLLYKLQPCAQPRSHLITPTHAKFAHHFKQFIFV